MPKNLIPTNNSAQPRWIILRGWVQEKKEHAHIHTCIHIHIHIHTCIYIDTYIHTNVCVCVCVFVCRERERERERDAPLVVAQKGFVTVTPTDFLD
jgi:hypothetical protein